jgi:oxazoline/thiazoline dehydrogenase
VTLVLSRYACLRAEGGRIVAEGAKAAAPLPLDDLAAVALIRELTSPRTLAEAAERARIPPAEAERLAAPLRAAGVLVGPEEAAAEAESVWSFHDRLLHARTRPADRSDWQMRAPPPALPPRDWQPTIDLERPDLGAIERDDPPLARVQADRRSERVHGPEPLSPGRLGEFLFRVGRVNDVWQFWGLTFVSRPYPSAGALYELEFYLAVEACGDIEPGIYHYAGDDHRLALISEANAASERLLSDAAAGMGVESRPQVLIVLAARFPRIASKYGPLAYSLVLKNVGVVLQTMYLTATAMGLAGCAVGAGNAAVFAEATGLSQEEETSVGEFCLGVPAGR